MSNFDTRFGIGSLLVALGGAFILGNVGMVNSVFWTFVGLFLLFEGVYYTVEYTSRSRKIDIEGYLFMIFIGIAILLFTFSILQFSFTLLIAMCLVSIGLAYLVKGFFYKPHSRDLFAGLILIALGIIFFIPSLINISPITYRIMREFGLGILLIVFGIVILIPRKGGKNQ